MGMRQRLGVAACLIGDPELLILDEPMNGLDPAGMHEMRDMIRSLVAEGRTVVLSSHLLDEVERTCDAVAIVDRGNVIRQGPISELLAGTSLTLQVDCSEPDRARDAARGDQSRSDRRRRCRMGWPSRCPLARPRDVIAEVARVAGHRWDLAVSTAADPSLARVVVPAGHQPTGRSRGDNRL